MQAFQWGNKTKSKQNNQPQTHYISSFQSISRQWLHPKKTELSHHKKDFCTGIPRQAQTKAYWKSHGKKPSVRFSLSRASVHHLSQQVTQDHPSLIIVLLLFLKEVHLYILNLQLWRICFPKYLVPNVTISENTEFSDLLRLSTTTKSLKTPRPIFVASQSLMRPL